MGGAGFPTYVKLNPGKPIEAVLVNACECEPMLTADHRMLLEYADDIIFGLLAEMKTVAAPKGIIVIEENKPDLFKESLALNPTGRMATPEEVARGIVFLASPASSFTTGTNLVIDGALTSGVQL